MAGFGDLVDGNQFDEINRRLSEVAHDLKTRLGIQEMIDALADRYDLALSPGALVLLSVPLFEAAFAQHFRESMGIREDLLDVESSDIQRTLDGLISDMASEPARADMVPEELTGVDERGVERRIRSSLSVTKSLAKGWCNIPPFCGEA